MTSAPSTLIGLQAKLVQNLGTINSGIVGDANHVRDGGYHIGAQSLRNAGMGGDYSLQFEADRFATHDWACALDIGGSADLLMTLGNRLVNALHAHDLRVYKRIRAVNAPWAGVSIDRRFDMESPSTPLDDNVQSNSDRGHIHVEIYRTLVTSQTVADGLYSVLAGVKPVPTPTPAPTPAAPGKKLYQGEHYPDLIRPGSGQYFGLLSGPAQSHGGATRAEQIYVTKIQRRLIQCGFVSGVTNPYSAWADGRFEKATADAVSRFQHKYMPGTSFYGQVWSDDWTKLFNI